MTIRIHQNMDQLSVSQWNRLTTDDNPFLRHEFLAAMEHAGCVGEQHGWIPQHIALYDHDKLVAASPLYIKYNSYGEFVFDWAWAEAYERAGLHYYPKLVSAIPYTPATGRRILLAPDLVTKHQQDTARNRLLEATLQHAEQLECSSMHWLFPSPEESPPFEGQGLIRRIDCQFHWYNRGYHSFDDFLQSLTSKKRKNIRHERRNAQSHNLDIEIISGDSATEEQLLAAETFYRSTFDKKWGYATFNLDFFKEISATMGKQLILILARDKKHYVAGAICYRSNNSLYGRHWGCITEYNHLHFELCYYQGIEYCIQEGLQLFEPGAQGEHKLSRGFLPATTQSYHWIASPQFRGAIQDYVQREKAGIRHYIDELKLHTPYRTEQETAL